MIHSIAARSVRGHGSTFNPFSVAHLLACGTNSRVWLDRLLAQRAARCADCLTRLHGRGLLRDRYADSLSESVARWELPTLLLAFLALGLISALRAQFVLAALAEVHVRAFGDIGHAHGARRLDGFGPIHAVGAWFALLFATAYVLGVATWRRLTSSARSTSMC